MTVAVTLLYRHTLMNLTGFDALLKLHIPCEFVTRDSAALIVLGPARRTLSARLAERPRTVIDHTGVTVHFGLPFYTAPYPLLVAAVITEKNTVFDALSLFGWIEDNSIYEPRAEVIGLTPYGEQPVMFLRDFDMDRPVELWAQTGQPTRWVRIAGVAIASLDSAATYQTLTSDDGALQALQEALPADAQEFAESLRLEAARSAGTPLKTLLRARRKLADAALMAQADGWRVIAQATPLLRVNPDADGDHAQVSALLNGAAQ